MRKRASKFEVNKRESGRRSRGTVKDGDSEIPSERKNQGVGRKFRVARAQEEIKGQELRRDRVGQSSGGG